MPPPAPLTERSLAGATRVLARRDPALRAIVARHGPPPLWPRPGGFRTLARMILEQQVSLDSAATLFRRLDRELPGGLRAAPVADGGAARAERRLRARGVTRQKARYLAALARRVAAEPGWLARLAREERDAVACASLMELPGIGPWTANVYLLFVHRRPDIWPPGDLALHIALGEAHGRAPFASAEATAWAARWAPHRATAARILWHGYLSDRGRS